MTRSRRDLLARVGSALAATGAAGAAGCLDFAAGDGPQGPEGTPETLSCADEAFIRLEPPFSDPVETQTVSEDAAESSFELSAEGTAETYGSSLRLVLRNTGESTASTLGEHAYSIQRRTAGGWQDVRGSATGDPVELPRDDDTIVASATYSWSLRLTEEGVRSAVPDRELDVCPPLGPGTHRFVYWGLIAGPPIGVEFELVG